VSIPLCRSHVPARWSGIHEKRPINPTVSLPRAGPLFWDSLDFDAHSLRPLFRKRTQSTCLLFHEEIDRPFRSILPHRFARPPPPQGRLEVFFCGRLAGAAPSFCFRRLAVPNHGLLTARAPRVLIVVVGLEVHHRAMSQLSPNRWIDVRKLLPHDPDYIKGESTLDSVAKSSGFVEQVRYVVDAAMMHQFIAVCCSKGKHRSVVVSAAARVMLEHCGS